MDALEGLRPATARTIIGRLKAGTVPETGAQYFTVGRDQWLKSIRQDLEDVAEEGDRKLRIFNGRYGDGKTHLMRLVQALGWDLGFVVAYVALERETPLNKWDRLYQAVVTSLQSAQRPRRPGLGALIDPNDPDPAIKASFTVQAETIRSLSHLQGDFLTACYRYSTSQGTSVDSDADLVTIRNWLEGKPVAKAILTPLGISAPTSRSDGPRLFEALVGVLRHFGFAGLLVLLDEVESTLALRNRGDRDAAYDNLRLFVDRTVLPDYSMAIFSTTPEMFTDPDRGFQSYPALWSRVSADRPDGVVNYRATTVDLAAVPPTASDFRTIAARIRAIHELAFSWDSSPRFGSDYVEAAAELAGRGRLALAVSPTRVFIKLMIEELELTHQHEAYRANLDRLTVRFLEIGEQLAKDESR